MQQAAKTLGRPPKGLVGPPFPDRYGHLWEAFVDLHNGRSYNAMGPDPIAWSEIMAWDTLTRAGLQEWEIRVIKALDSLWLRIASEDSNG